MKSSHETGMFEICLICGYALCKYTFIWMNMALGDSFMFPNLFT